MSVVAGCTAVKVIFFPFFFFLLLLLNCDSVYVGVAFSSQVGFWGYGSTTHSPQSIPVH